MITKLRLSDNASLGNISTNSPVVPPVVQGDYSNSEDPSLEGMKSDDQCTSDQHENGPGARHWSCREKAIPGPLASDDSCNAVDNKLRGADDSNSHAGASIGDSDLSFNGKIKPLNIDAPIIATNRLETRVSANGGRMSCELIDATKGFERADPAVADDKHRGRARKDRLNESFELLTKENSSWLHYRNEKSPDLFTDDPIDEGNVNHVDTGIDDPDVEADGESLRRNSNRSGGLETEYLDCVSDDAPARSDTIERILLKRLQASLSGVPPPPSLTYSNIGIERMLDIYHSNSKQWWNECQQLSTARKEGDCIQTKTLPECLSKPTHLTTDLNTIAWPDLIRHRAHGLHYNKSTATEKLELLGIKYIERYISAETSSSFNMALSPSSAKKRNQRMKMLNQSPGSRLSHLARRRAIFSSANLLNNSGGSGAKAGTIVSAGRGNITAGALNRLNPFRLCNRQVLLDPKKSENRRKNKVKTPQRRSPGFGRKSPRRRTPGSSAKKLSLARANASAKPSQQLHGPATVESSKRALFLSPPNGPASGARYDQTGDSRGKQTDRSIFSEARMLKSKRSLFSPPRSSDEGGGQPMATSHLGEAKMALFGVGTSRGESVSMSLKRRRSPTGDDEEQTAGMSDERTEKIRRKESSALVEEDLTPRSLKFARSQSFCVASQTVSRVGSQIAISDCGARIVGGKSLFRSNSEITSDDGHRPVMMLTENHKKKLLWAVSQALKDKQVPTKHEKFKQHASNLARVVKRLFLEFNDQTISSTSEKLLRLSNKLVYEVIQGKSVDDIYFREKTRIMNARNHTKLTGYIAPEEYELRKLTRVGSLTSVNGSVDGASPFASSLSASQSLFSQNSMLSQGSSVGGSFSQLSEVASGSVVLGRQLKAAASTGSMHIVGVGGGSVVQGGSLITTALRENIDSELRQRSTQKQLPFSGKDHKNVSPFRVDNGRNPGSLANSNNKLLVGGALNSSIMKAKRQISFE